MSRALTGVLGLKALFSGYYDSAHFGAFRAGRNAEKRRARAPGAPYGLRVKLYSDRRLRQRGQA